MKAYNLLYFGSKMDTQTILMDFIRDELLRGRKADLKPKMIYLELESSFAWDFTNGYLYRRSLRLSDSR